MWGDNSVCQLGLGPDAGGRKLEPVVVPKLQGAVQLACGWGHVICLVQKETPADPPRTLVYTWGFNLHGQLGVGSTKNEGTPTHVTALDDYVITAVTCAGHVSGCISENGDVCMWGSGQRGRVGGEKCADSLVPVRCVYLSFNVFTFPLMCLPFL